MPMQRNLTTKARISLTKIPGLTINPLPPVPLPLPPFPIVQLTPLGAHAVAPGSARTRPLWFNGRFLAAQDLERDQNYFLAMQAWLGQAAGFGVVHGLGVEQTDAETLVIGAGQGITPGGGLVTLSDDLTVRLSDLVEEETLEQAFGLARNPRPIPRSRTGLFVLALRPAEFTANPITAYPSSLQGTRTHDGSVIEASALSIVPFPVPVANMDAPSQNASAARQVFVENAAGTRSSSLLPIAMIGVQRGAITWVDEYMVRRESGPEMSTLRFGLSEMAASQAYFRQYDAQLRRLVQPMLDAHQTPVFPAATFFEALPPAGPLPMGCIDPAGQTQLFFPPATAVTLSLVPDDELPAIIDSSLALQPIDLTLAASAFADLGVVILIPVSRDDYDKLSPALTPIALSSRAPQALGVAAPRDLLGAFRGLLDPPLSNNGPLWKTAIGDRPYGYYARRRSAPAFVSFQPVGTKVALTVSAVVGSGALRYSATVTPAEASGTVVFKDGGVNIGTVDLKSGVATLVLPTLPAGSHSLTAVYLGDTNHLTGTSPVVVQNIPGA